MSTSINQAATGGVTGGHAFAGGAGHASPLRTKLVPAAAFDRSDSLVRVAAVDLDEFEPSRAELIRSVRAQLARGGYETFERLDAAADLLLSSL
ncbi:MAG: hypothetical protein WCK33_01190 [Phycisphaerae bacterium]|jgi:hypothetical protein